MSHWFRPFLHFLFHVGYFGPFVLGILDSSFLVLPFGNDLLVVGLIARHHGGFPFYVLSAACGSTVGVLLLASVSRKFGEEGIRKVAGQKQFEKLKKRIGERSGIAVAIGCLAPPPFPFTMVIAAASALGYSLWRVAVINFVSRAVRFTVLGLLALKFGTAILRIAKSPAFVWSMVVFIALCLIASVFSIWHWVHSTRSGKHPEPTTSKT
ncbi:MAG TPA: VTT domain-containing protein [Acidobacteriaceae bacterium]|nr:VTT domain-containing protein [Acidobacteriaceae bacterium]